MGKGAPGLNSSSVCWTRRTFSLIFWFFFFKWRKWGGGMKVDFRGHIVVALRKSRLYGNPVGGDISAQTFRHTFNRLRRLVCIWLNATWCTVSSMWRGSCLSRVIMITNIFNVKLVTKHYWGHLYNLYECIVLLYWTYPTNAFYCKAIMWGKK